MLRASLKGHLSVFGVKFLVRAALLVTAVIHRTNVYSLHSRAQTVILGTADLSVLGITVGCSEALERRLHSKNSNLS